MAETQQTIKLDMKTRAIVSGARIVIQKLKPNGEWDMTDHFTGGARSIMQWAERNGVYPTRDAEQRIAALPEAGFRDRS